MYSSMRVFFYALNLLAWSLLVFVGTTPAVAPALAAPLALPMYRSADFAPRIPSNASTSAPPTSSAGRRELNPLGVLEGFTKLGSTTRRDTSNILSQIAILNNYYNGMQSNVEAFRTMCQDPTTRKSENFKTQSANKVTEFHSNLLGFDSVLQELGADKGLANYDRTNDLETLLKDLVNATKYLLGDIYEIVNDDPTLGPTLGPIVYEIKCILDEVLDAVENLTDAIINAIKPLLQGLIGTASKTACGSGLQIAGLCLI